MSLVTCAVYTAAERMIGCDETEAQFLRSALEETFPPVKLSFAYGSAVFQQHTSNSSGAIMDFVFAVDDPIKWHEENLMRNRSHYSFLKYFGAQAIVNIQRNHGATVYYNTLVDLKVRSQTDRSRVIKYGVISCDDLCNDLRNWTCLYLSGRLHKPVRILHNNDERLLIASRQNLLHAVHYALLNLPEKFTKQKLFMKIASISYAGDFRMTFGENPKKVRNIVDGNFQAFCRLYENTIRRCTFLKTSMHDPTVFLAATGDKSSRQKLLHVMPSNVRDQIARYSKGIDQECLQKVVRGIVRRTSRSQSIKGIFTAGGIKAAQYALQKINRAYFSRSG
uniref:Phosphatidate cytidylyltransferase, mitochondrial n=1 Tax=Albugo laibachii Nc14 TaxID=890382 RepID=F0WJ87_9STRA|nr:MMP37like protein putative [Albugo laibachii Nc14]|eukprot:CCA21334.1 MMP37like protein putative [Albugo laibachii Nc14]